MADQKISELTNITGANLADADEFVVVDVSADQTKAVTRAEFFKNTPSIDVTGNVTASDMFITGPTPVLTLTDDDVADENTQILNSSGNTFIDSRNGASDGQFIVRGKGGGVATEHFRANANGVGIFNSSPTAPLDVTGSAKISGNLTVDTSTLHVDSTNNRVGVGTTSPTERLDVANGVARFSNNITPEVENDGAAYFGKIGNIAAVSGSAGVAFRQNGAELGRINSTGLGIGEAAPATLLHLSANNAGITTAGTGNNTIRFEDTDTTKIGGQVTGTIDWYTNDADATGVQAWITADSTNVGAGALAFGTGVAGATEERLRIDASGNVLVGKTSANFSTAGVQLQSATASSFTQDGVQPLVLNRLTSDGDILKLFKDGGAVGSIGSNGGSPYFTTTDGGFRIAGNGALQPATSTGAVSDGLEDLGSTAGRWRDFYLSGGVYLGGNKLDDYEEGTWTPVISDGTNNATSDIAVATYTKIGNHVHVQGRIRLSSLGSASGSLRITGLPFNANAVTNSFSAMTIGRAVGLNLTVGTAVCGDLRANVDYVLLNVWDAALGNTGLQDTEFSSDGDISFSMNYLSV